MTLMPELMTRRERLEALRRDQPVDRPAWSLWRHFYDQESTADGLVSAMAGWQRAYDFDFLKVNPRAQYHVEPWGAIFRYPGGRSGRPEPITLPVHQLSDWNRIEPLSATLDAFGEQIEVLRRLRQILGPEVPFIETIFTPLSVIGDMVESDDQLVEHLRTDPAQVVPALEAVTQTLAEFATECLGAGADGIFLATTQWASRDLLTDEEYLRFGRPYDLQVLQAVAGASFNVLHVCGEHCMLFELADYPVHAVNWAVTSATTPSLEEASEQVPTLLIGGLSHEALAARTAEAALAEFRAAYQATGGRRWMLGADCTVRPGAREETLSALKEAVHSGVPSS